MNTMRISLGMIAVGAVLAVGLAVFATWHVVGDAPWEDSDSPVLRPNPTRQLSQCDVLQQQVADARTEAGAVRLHRQGQDLGCW